jgi:hypothetical protein
LVVHGRSASSGAISTPQTPAAGGFTACLCRAGRGASWSGPACYDEGAVKRLGQNVRLFDRMTHPPLDNPNRIAPLHGRAGAAATWLAFVALLGNVLLPVALSIIVLKEPGGGIPGVGICGHWPADAPGKTKPGLVVHHCPLCTVPLAPLPRSPRFAVPGEVAAGSRPQQPLTTVSVAPVRRGRMQARAPPSVV